MARITSLAALCCALWASIAHADKAPGKLVPVVRTHVTSAQPQVWEAKARQVGRSPNFVVQVIEGSEDADAIAQAAEAHRKQLFGEWFGYEAPNWSKPATIKVKAGPIPAGGETHYKHDGGEVWGWKMQISGPRERLAVSVLPHEINHTVFASHFRRPTPRWFDEGCAEAVEDCEEHARQRGIFKRKLEAGQVYRLGKLMSAMEYPRDVGSFYAESFCLVEFLIGKRGIDALLAYGADYTTAGAIRHLGYQSPESLEAEFLPWFRSKYGADTRCKAPPGVRANAPPGSWGTRGIFDCQPLPRRRTRPTRPVRPTRPTRPDNSIWTPVPTRPRTVPIPPRTRVRPTRGVDAVEAEPMKPLEVVGVVALIVIGGYVFFMHAGPWLVCKFLERFGAYRAKFRAGETPLSGAIQRAEAGGYEPMTGFGKSVFDLVDDAKGEQQVKQAERKAKVAEAQATEAKAKAQKKAADKEAA